MLVLSRKIGERIHIGGDTFVEVRRVAGNRVTLAVSAPKEVRILRGELFEAAGSFDVLDDEPSVTESTTDTVIMKQSKQPADQSSPAASNPDNSPSVEHSLSSTNRNR